MTFDLSVSPWVRLLPGCGSSWSTPHLSLLDSASPPGCYHPHLPLSLPLFNISLPFHIFSSPFPCPYILACGTGPIVMCVRLAVPMSLCPVRLPLSLRLPRSSPGEGGCITTACGSTVLRENTAAPSVTNSRAFSDLLCILPPVCPTFCPQSARQQNTG